MYRLLRRDWTTIYSIGFTWRRFPSYRNTVSK
ncbi:hypothetical protein VP501E541_P0145 [Vibrio phage 501E54-1]|nr:hypothetical protein VP501E541_P0145 [Vibrio phage 501E54-1]